MIPSNRISSDYATGIDLVALWRVVWGHKYVILLSAILCGAVAVVLALTATPVYRAQVVLTEVQDNGLGAGATLARQLGGLASLAGANLPAVGSASRESQAVLQSRRLVEEFIRRNDLLKELFAHARKPPTLWFGVERFQDDVLAIREDARKGTTTITIDWTDPVTAAKWANGIVALANDLIRSRALQDSTRNINYLNEQITHTKVVEVQRVMYNLIESETKTLMLANARAEYAFAVVDPAVIPEMRISPRRTLMVLLGVTLGGVLGTVLAFVLNMIGLRRDAAQQRLNREPMG